MAGRGELSDEPAVPAVPLRRNRNFQLLWVGQVLSNLGTEFGLLAYPLLVLALTRSAVIAGLVGTVSTGVAFLARLPAGALADRVDRRRAMIVCDVVRTLVLAGLALGVALRAVSWPLVLAAAVVDRTGDTIFSPSSMAALPAIVEDEQLEGAWAATEGRQYAAGLAGPALGGLLYGIGRAVPFLGDAISYGVSVLTSSGLRGDFTTEKQERRGLWREALEGLRLMLGDTLLRALVVQAPLMNFAFSGALFTVILGLRQHGLTATVIGLVEASISAGGLAGAVVASKVQAHLSLYGLILLISVGGALAFAVGAAVMPSPLVAVPLTLPVVLAAPTNAGVVAVMLRRTPAEMRGRVSNSLLQLTSALSALSPLVAGLLVGEVSSNWAMGAFALSLAVSAGMALMTRSLRAVTRDLSEGPAPA